MNMRRITRTLLRHHGTDPELVPEDGLTLREFLEMENIDVGERLWIATRYPDATTIRWLGVVVRRALGRAQDPDNRLLAVLPYLDRGVWVPKDVERQAMDAADTWDPVPRSLASNWRDAAYAAARSTQPELSTEQAAGVTRAALDYSAYSAGDAKDEERKQQIRDLLDLLGKEPVPG
jgi:hypothetical protein